MTGNTYTRSCVWRGQNYLTVIYFGSFAAEWDGCEAWVGVQLSCKERGNPNEPQRDDETYTVRPRRDPWGAEQRSEMPQGTSWWQKGVELPPFWPALMCKTVCTERHNAKKKHAQTHTVPLEVTIWGTASSTVLQSPLGKKERKKKTDMTSVGSMMARRRLGPRQWCGQCCSCRTRVRFIGRVCLHSHLKFSHWSLTVHLPTTFSQCS